MWHIRLFTVLTVGLYLSCSDPHKRSVGNVAAVKGLAEHSKIFKKEVIKVEGTDNVYVAIGFGLANSIMVVGKTGVIIIDTMETREEARPVLAAFRKITKKPVKAIIYTHNHADHIFGAEVFAGASGPQIYAHESTLYYVNRIVSKLRPTIGARSLRMFGSYLDEKGLVNAGIGPILGVGPDSTVGFLPPTKTFKSSMKATVAGIDFELVHAPGETNDQLFVWLPRQKVLMPGDNFYATFPNLYTIRGTPFRSLQQWYKSLDLMRARRPEVLVPSHTRPLRGSKQIYQVLTNYRDAIQYIHDQSIRGINMGMTPDQLAEHVVLPKHLRDLPYLQEYYGKPSWSARAMFVGNMGWFDGDPATLQPLPPLEQAKLMARLAGGEGGLREHAEKALKSKEYQIALQLSGHLLRLDDGDSSAKDIRIKALTGLAEKEHNPNARHYYLTEVLELRDGFVSKATAKPSTKLLRGLPLQGFFEALAVNLDAEASIDDEKLVGMAFPDAGEAYTIEIRRGIAEIRKRKIGELARLPLDIHAVANSLKWKEILAEVRNPVTTVAGFSFKKGGTVSFLAFLNMFRPAKQKLAHQPRD